MTQWREEDHPRDDEGKFTYKNGGVSNRESYEDKMQRRADILFPTMKDKLPKVNYDNIGLGLGNFVKEKLSREDILFPSMKDKKEIIKEEPNIEQIKINKKDIGYVTGGAADIKKNINSISADKRNHVPDTKKALEILGLNSNDYVLNGNTITAKTKPKQDKEEYYIIDHKKYPKYSDDPEVRKRTSQALSRDNEKYLENNAQIEQWGVDGISNPFIKTGVKARYWWGKETAENLHMSKTDFYLDTDYAKKHQVLNNYKEMPEILHEYFSKKIPQQVGNDKLETMKGVFYDEQSEPSNNLKRNLLADEDFLNKLKKYDTALNNKFSVNDSIALKGENWSHAVGNADIRDMHINKNGDLELYIADVYDFNEGEKSNAVRVGRNRQEKGEITPYFYAYRVIIPRAEMKKALKNQKK